MIKHDDIENMSQRALMEFIAHELIDQRPKEKQANKYRCPDCAAETVEPYGDYCPECGSNECHIELTDTPPPM